MHRKALIKTTLSAQVRCAGPFGETGCCRGYDPAENAETAFFGDFSEKTEPHFLQKGEKQAVRSLFLRSLTGLFFGPAFFFAFFLLFCKNGDSRLTQFYRL